MAGYESRDGKIAGNRQLVESHDRNQGKRSSHMGMEKLKGAGSGGGKDAMGGGGDHEEIKSVVAKHGPAHRHTISKGEMGGHQSETEHEDGHVHTAEHESLADAHAHGLEAMGEGSDDAETSSMLPMDEDEAGEKSRGERGGGFMGDM